jgi:hypothetical protein
MAESVDSHQKTIVINPMNYKLNEQSRGNQRSVSKATTAKQEMTPQNIMLSNQKANIHRTKMLAGASEHQTVS